MMFVFLPPVVGDVLFYNRNSSVSVTYACCGNSSAHTHSHTCSHLYKLRVMLLANDPFREWVTEVGEGFCLVDLLS